MCRHGRAGTRPPAPDPPGRYTGSLSFSDQSPSSHCGDVQAARETIAAKSKAPGHIQSLVTAIRPAVEATAKSDLEATIKANVNDVVRALRSSTPILKAKADSGDVRVIGGYYSLDSGSVSFLDEK